MSEANFGTSRVPLLKHVYRVSAYVIAAIMSLLGIATVSGRLMVVDDPWQFFAMGAVIGVTGSCIGPGVESLPSDIPARRAFPWLLFAVTSAALCAVMRMAMPGILLSWAGIVAVGLVSSALFGLVYVVTNVPESSGDR